MRIGELSTRLGLSTATLRYYETLGLLGQPERTASGYRLYGDDDEQRLRFIVRAKALDLTLDEIGMLLDFWHEGGCRETRSTLRHLVAHKIKEARSRAQEAETFANQLANVYVRLGQDIDSSPAECGCIPDLPVLEPFVLDAELSRIEASVCGCSASLEESSTGSLAACACGCCGPSITPGFITIRPREEVNAQ